MPGLNSTRAEAAERAAHLAIQSYDLTLDLTCGEEIFISTTVIKFSCDKAGYETFIDAVGKSVISATLNGQAVDTSNYDGESIFLKNLALENELVIKMNGLYSQTGEGLQRSVDPVDNEIYLYSQGETAFIRKMYPCFDQPDLKATFTLTVIAPSHWSVISNNPVKKKIELADNKSQTSFTTTPRISTYITALIAGPYYCVTDQYVGKKTVPLGIYCRKSLAQHLDPADIFLITKQGFAYFEKVFGLEYPFEKYDQIAVVDFNWGAMENAGAVTFLERLLVFRSKVTERMYNARANTILHEMAHMWFGNMVTMKWWDDLWLNESFAEWSSYLAMVEGTRFKNSWTGFNQERKNWAYRQDQLTTTHPIVSDMVDIDTVAGNFDGISYAKGASVLQQLVAHVGRDNFILGLQKYFAKHAFKNTTLDDLLSELTITSGRDLKPWVATWLQTAGVNTLRPALDTENGVYKSITVIQEPPAMPVGSKELRPHRMAVGLYDLKGEKIALRKSVELDVTGDKTLVTELAGEKVADLLLINDRDLSYGKVRFDDKSIATLKAHLGKIDDSLTRALCWSAAWDMLRDAEISATDFIDIALAGLPGEDDIATVTIIANQLATAVELYSAPTKRDSARLRVGNAYEKMLQNAKAGSDHQLQFARNFTAFASSAEHNDLIKELLEGKLAGLKVDADLRWSLVTALAERGLMDKAALSAELLKDNTLTGQLSHATCLAALPTAAAKEETWNSITTEEISTSLREAKLAGFMRPLHRPLLAAYVDPYFDLLLETWGKKSYEVASKFVSGMYPIYITNQMTLDKTINWLATTGKDGQAGLRRLVSESRDSLERALKVQAKDK
ncbi:MAG: aminopeptidase N [Actinobacteria bacterium]|nr:aminopeptidase N [Actinomycetota bacterium]